MPYIYLNYTLIILKLYFNYDNEHSLAYPEIAMKGDLTDNFSLVQYKIEGSGLIAL